MQRVRAGKPAAAFFVSGANFAHKMQTIRTDEKRAMILGALAAGYSFTAAAEAAGISRTALYAWKNDEPEFDAACRDAIEAGTDRLEDEGLRRALDSSDTMLIFMLKARRRDKFGDRQHVEHSGEVVTKEQRDAIVRAAANANS